METIVVDDEQLAIDVFCRETSEIEEIHIIKTFLNGKEALAFAKEQKVELAILDIKMPEINGIELGKELKKIYPDIMLIYVTGFENYAMDAIKLHVAGYLLKPYSKEDVEYAVQSAKLLSKRFRKRIYAQTFGHFDLFVDGKPLMFKSAKAKELLALLIDRCGGTMNTDQIITNLWEDRENDEATQNLCSKVVRTLINELERVNAAHIVQNSRGLRCIDMEELSCDLYELLDGDENAKKKFYGEYMVDYSWGEYRIGAIESFIQMS